MMTDWIDKLADVWAISDQKFGTVKSYRLVAAADFPASIDASALARTPIALTIPASMTPEYSLGGPRIAIYKGVTEFHVAPDIDKARLPELLRWYEKILTAAAGNMKLSGTVEYFLLDGEDAIAGPLQIQYGSEAPHWGFLVTWIVKEHISLSVSA
jgi:hypothetical protein